MPAGGHRPGLGLAIADDAGHDQVGIVERRAEGVGQGIAELAAFMDRARRFRGHMAWNSSREGKLLEQPLHSLGVGGHVGVHLAVGPFEPGIGHQAPARHGPDR